MKSITFITGNAAKVQFMSDYFGRPFEHVKLDQPEIQSLDLREVTEAKARNAFAAIKKPVLVEDVSLVLLAMKKLPGPFIKWFVESLGDEGVCTLATQIGDRRAHVEIMFALYDGKNMQTFIGEMDGTIALKPDGENGLGWDTVFINDGYDITRAKMAEKDKEEWRVTGMRNKALVKMHEYFNNQEK
ncbi:hypothetical protein A3A36_00840 [Candidatus Kaiserbacteria bacterium RIFCSPLOWO2_01_FULL_52_12b]|uniref:Non-canonical purine NTP pyrophosphatase n=1 Tax=Candidatus Kaiserbacteria bacterium RIFCSPLOWO2_01_FULL_52_12b TaxID=1798509 RepID=A0A1F6EXI6_9BACT|nr:MAG: hypothetical protein A3A36_00840 [Candidatus Kaiserbacteria bacterium RIFCSPLOWO2_01_FULL_52_12b]